MNPTIKRNISERQAARQASSTATQQMVSADLSSPPPQGNDAYGGEGQIARAFKPLTQRYAYFSQETNAAFALMLLAAGSAIVVPYLLGWSMVSIAVFCVSCIGALLGAYYWYFHRYGPEFIDEARFQLANRRLQDSGDQDLKPLGLLPMLTLVGILSIDGFLSGSSLTAGVFQNVFTPRWALAAAAAWGLAVTYLLYKLSHAAALEANINDRRELIRNLMVSSDPDDQARAKRMKAAVGDRLGQSLDLKDDRVSARVALAAVTLIIAVSMFAIRIGDRDSENQQAAGIGMPEATSTSVNHLRV